MRWQRCHLVALFHLVRLFHLVALCVVAAVLAACGPGPAATDDGQQLVVQAAASLTDVFAEIEAGLERADPGLDVVVNVAGSQTLATQIVQGIPAAVFASANQQQMAVVSRAGQVDGAPQVFATNRLAIAVAAGNPLGIDGLGALARDDVVVVLADPAVPAGQFAQQALDRAGVIVTPASLEQDVRAVVSRIELGEADAGIVYTTDVTGRAVQAVAIPAHQNVTSAYEIAVLAAAPSPDAARLFVDYVLSPSGQQIMTASGFGPP